MTGLVPAQRLLTAAQRVLRARALLASAEAGLAAERAALGAAAGPLLRELLGEGGATGMPLVAVDRIRPAPVAVVQAAAKAPETLATEVDQIAAAAAADVQGTVSVAAYAARLGLAGEQLVHPLIKRGVLAAPAVVLDGRGRRRIRPELADAQILAAGLIKSSTVRAAVERLASGAAPAPAAADERPAAASGGGPATVTVGQYASGLGVPNGAITSLVRGGVLRGPAVTAAKRIVPEAADRQLLARKFGKPSVVQQRVRERAGLSEAEQAAVDKAIAEGRVTKDPGPERFEGGMRFGRPGGGAVDVGL